MEKVVVAKIITGEYIIGKLDEKKEKIQQPFMIMPNTLNDITPAIALIPVFWFFGKDHKSENVEIKLKDVICYTDAPAGLTNKYNEIISNIVVISGNNMPALNINTKIKK